MSTVKRAIISLSDKTGIEEFARALVRFGYHLISTGGTAATLEKAGIEVERVEDLTGFPEMLGGRVKTLHPKVHAGILARDTAEDMAKLQEMGIEPISLVVVNLYPFKETIAREGVTLAEAVEQIDIGGPTMVRAAAKNFARVAVVVNPQRYPEIIKELEERGEISPATRLDLAREAFWHTAVYDAAVANYLYGVETGDKAPDFNRSYEQPRFASRLILPLARLADLRYGENPHQKAAFYREEGVVPYGVAGARQLNGKELSYNNILDLHAALKIAAEFEDPAAVVIKHNTPSGVACRESLAEAFRRAREADPVAAYGGVIGLNRLVDAGTAEAIGESFFEAVIAPAYTPEALKILCARQNLRVMEVGDLAGLRGRLDMKRVSGGFLLQEADDRLITLERLRKESKVVTSKAPTDEQWEDLLFGWTVARHVFSNAIVIAKNGVTLGIGGGQVSRVDAAWIALTKAGDKARGAVLASDGFIPFPDSLQKAIAAGVTAVIQPGGSIRDDEVIAAAEAAGIAMVCTGRRHFKH